VCVCVCPASSDFEPGTDFLETLIGRYAIGIPYWYTVLLNKNVIFQLTCQLGAIPVQLNVSPYQCRQIGYSRPSKQMQHLLCKPNRLWLMKSVWPAFDGVSNKRLALRILVSR
jgi:hypothetical protein